MEKLKMVSGGGATGLQLISRVFLQPPTQPHSSP